MYFEKPAIDKYQSEIERLEKALEFALHKRKEVENKYTPQVVELEEKNAHSIEKIKQDFAIKQTEKAQFYQNSLKMLFAELSKEEEILIKQQKEELIEIEKIYQRQLGELRQKVKEQSQKATNKRIEKNKGALSDLEKKLNEMKEKAKQFT